MSVSTNLLRVHEELNKMHRVYLGPDEDGETQITPSATAETKVTPEYAD